MRTRSKRPPVPLGRLVSQESQRLQLSIFGVPAVRGRREDANPKPMSQSQKINMSDHIADSITGVIATPESSAQAPLTLRPK